ncbi:MAG: cation diffusion facilitator family transporter [Imperialibacter sp.]|uniref:cation diffusion facilitator family transporter n=1 Tax=Imperialibacter sp. TaxID=2038411 RepID=UPI0032EE6419
MAHQHGHHQGHHHHHEHDSSGKLRAVFFINLIFAILELIGGLLTNSMAILSDALHDLGDSMAIGLSWIFERISRKKRDKNFSYGYKRFSLISATISGLILFAGSVIIIIEAVPRFWNPEPVQTFGMLIFSVLGILVNGAAAWKMWGGKTANEKVVKWHLLEDVLGWVAVLIGSIVIHFTDWYFIDPLLSIGIAVFILFGVYRTLSETITIFLQAVPDDVSVKVIHDQLMTIDHVSDVHDIHVWTMDGQYNVLSCHLVVEDDASSQVVAAVKRDARKVATSFGINHQTFEVETTKDVCEYEDC